MDKNRNVLYKKYICSFDFYKQPTIGSAFFCDVYVTFLTLGGSNALYREVNWLWHVYPTIIKI